MTQFEMVEKLREKANVTYEEAKAALEAANWDLLDAMVLLEKEGRMGSEASAEYTTRTERKKPEAEGKDCGRTFSITLGNIGRWIAKMIRRGNINTFEVQRKGESVLSLPVTALVLLLIFAFPFCMVLLIVGLFTGFRYSFRGPDLGIDAINNAISRASDAADEMKREKSETKE